MDHDNHHRWAFGRRLALRGMAFGGLGLPLLLSARRAAAAECGTTQSLPIEGPYFLGEPRLTSKTGTGLVVRGSVRDASTCAPVVGATIVRWHANRYGIYEDYYRAKLLTEGEGNYRFESIVPGQYAGLARHIHFAVSAPGYQSMITQWQIADGIDPGPEIEFDFALNPA